MAIDLDDYLKDELAADLASDRSRVRRDAITVLGRLGAGTRTLEVLKGLADSDPDEGLRTHARASYKEIWERARLAEGGKSMVADLADPAKLDYDRFARALREESPVRRLRAALEAITMGDPAMLHPALARLEVEQDDWVLATLVKVVGRSGTAEHVEKIQRFMEDESRPRLVANTIEAVAMLDPAGAKARLAKYLSASDNRVQATAALALFRTEKPTALDAFRQMTRAAAPRTREAAVAALARLAEPEGWDLLLAMLLAESNYNLTERVVAVLSAQGDVGVAAKALRISQLQSGVAAAFAYRRVVRAVGERLGVPEGALKDAVREPEMDLFLRKLAPDRGPEAGAASRAPKAVVKSTAVKVPVDGRLAAGALAVLIVTGVGVALWPMLGKPGEAAGPASTGAGAAAVSPQALASSRTPAAFTNQSVSWEGRVSSVVPGARTLYLAAGQEQIAAVFDDTLPELHEGDRVRVRGKVAGRSRLGPIHLHGLSVEKL